MIAWPAETGGRQAGASPTPPPTPTMLHGTLSHINYRHWTSISRLSAALPFVNSITKYLKDDITITSPNLFHLTTEAFAVTKV